MSVWHECRGIETIQEIKASAWRVVETQNKSYTRKLVDTDKELDILEDLLETSKPEVNEAIYNNYHYLLFTPFRYPPLKYGSRFGRRFEPSIWYGSQNMETALHEIAFYKLIFLQDTAANLELHLMLTAFSTNVHSEKGVDLTQPPFSKYRHQISDGLTYQYSQPLGTSMRDNLVELFLYFSARENSSKINIGCFYPTVFDAKKRIKQQLLWSCYASKETVELWHNDQEGKTMKIVCHASQFEKQGKLAYPTCLA